MKQELIDKFKEKIHSFDLCSLIGLLEKVGVKREEIYFESHQSQVSAPSLCQSIEFYTESPHVHITLNMGLLSSNSPLPSFFRKLMDNDEIDEEKFTRFLNYFDHHLLSEFTKVTLPETDKILFPNWNETHYNYLSLLGFESISTLWLIIKGCFPELVVDIQKKPRMAQMSSSSLVIGKGSLGPTSYLGERLEQTLSSFKVTFTTEEDVSEEGKPWPLVINERLYNWIFPLLEKTELHLSINLLIKHKVGSMHLSYSHHLGFDRIGQTNEPFHLLLFYGSVKEISRGKFIAS